MLHWLLPRHRLDAKGVLGTVLFLALAPSLAAAQTPARDSARSGPDAMAGPLGIPMARMGSGTSWTPEADPLPSRQFTAGAWNLMVHGAAFGQYDVQHGPRGGRQLGSLSWGMLMASRAAAGGRLTLRGMFSLDPLGVGACGYPLLLQTGETCHGQPLVDRQHPHDAVMELDAEYERAISRTVGILAYAAPVGEPALGPVAFMHRASAAHDPMAPLGHHWQDATHVTFGVVTAGVFTRTLRLEGSVFNGHEPDENRWNFDPIQLNSYSARATYDPGPNWSLTTGYGFISRPEALHPGESVHRLVASAAFATALGGGGRFAATAIVGSNATSGGQGVTNSALVEADFSPDGRNAFFGRAELVDKTAEELGVAGFGASRKFRVAESSLGFERRVIRAAGLAIGVGFLGTANAVPADLAGAYGSRTPLAIDVYLRVTPARAPAGATMDMNMPAMGQSNEEVRQ